MSMTSQPSESDAYAPTEFKIKSKERRLIVNWKDGHTSRYDLSFLRKNCPCATCNTEREKRSQSTELFPILSKDPGTGPPQLVGAQLVGNYAIQFTWSDGHATGIYDFVFLRSLDSQSG